MGAGPGSRGPGSPAEFPWRPADLQQDLLGEGRLSSLTPWNAQVPVLARGWERLLIGREGLEAIAATPPLGVFTGLSSDPTLGNLIPLEEPTSKPRLFDVQGL